MISNGVPLVSVVLTVHNGSAYLGPAVDSILSQSYRNLELVIVDDGSTDDTSKILSSYSDPRIRILSNNTNQGIPRSANRGLAVARGTYIARLDADDIALPERLARQIAFLERHPEIAIVGSDVHLISFKGTVRRGLREVRACTPLGVQCALMFGTPFVHSTAVFRRSVLVDEFGGYNEMFAVSEDFELFSRILTRYQGANLPDQLVCYRTHHNSATAQLRTAPDKRSMGLSRNIQVQCANLTRILCDDDLATSWPPLWSRLNVPWVLGSPTNTFEAPRIVAAIRRRFHARFPEASADREVARVFASVQARVACFLAPTARQLAIRTFAEAIQLDSKTSVRFLPTLAVNGALGERGLAIAREFRRRNARASG